MKKIKEITENKRFIPETALYVLFLYGITSCVFLNGDDFMYASFAKLGIVKSVSNYYITGNGRFWINIMDSLLLSFDRYLFIAVTPLIIMLFITLLAKNAQFIAQGRSDAQNERRFIRYSMVLFACLDVLCLRETAFWITGMMNYLFPAVIFLAAFLFFLHLRSDHNVSTIKKMIYCVACLFAGSSVEQFALMFVGMMTLILGSDLLNSRRVSKVLRVGYLCSLVGLSTLLLAPGNFVRVNTQSELMPGFIDNLWTLIYQDTMSPVAFPYLLMLSMCANTYIFQNCRAKWIRACSILIPISMVAIRCISIIEKAVLITGLLIVFCIQMIYMFIKQDLSGKQMTFFLAFVGIGSQIMLLISFIWGFRCMFSIYMVYMLLILYCLTKLNEAQRRFILCSGIVASLSPLAVVVLWCLLLLMKNRERAMRTMLNVITYSSVVAAMTILLLGYTSNVSTHVENIARTKQVSECGELRLQELPDDVYSWYSLPMGEFHENYYKVYHGIPDSVVINYETGTAVQ